MKLLYLIAQKQFMLHVSFRSTTRSTRMNAQYMIISSFSYMMSIQIFTYKKFYNLVTNYHGILSLIIMVFFFVSSKYNKDFYAKLMTFYCLRNVLGHLEATDRLQIILVNIQRYAKLSRNILRCTTYPHIKAHFLKMYWASGLCLYQ